jgi:hypothetical protein
MLNVSVWEMLILRKNIKTRRFFRTTAVYIFRGHSNLFLCQHQWRFHKYIFMCDAKRFFIDISNALTFHVLFAMSDKFEPKLFTWTGHGDAPTTVFSPIKIYLKGSNGDGCFECFASASLNSRNFPSFSFYDMEKARTNANSITIVK